MSTETLQPRSVSKGGYIVSATFDHLVFIWPPLWFFALAWLIVVAGMADFSITLGDPASDGLHIALFPTVALTFTMAHVVAVVFRSHLNRQIFNCYPYRFGRPYCLNRAVQRLTNRLAGRFSAAHLDGYLAFKPTNVRFWAPLRHACRQ